jgi:agmatinase
MNLPFEYERLATGEFGGTTPTTTDFEHARVVIFPVPLDRTTSYVPGTRNGPHEILVASSHMELWDEETGTDVHGIGVFTLPEMEFPFATMEEVIKEIRRVATEIVSRDKFPVVLGGEHSITAPVVAALAAKHRGLSVLQIDAHADLRESYMGTPHNHACAMRRVLEYARTTQVGVRSLSPEEAAAVPTLPTEIFYDYNMRRHEDWIDRVVASLGDTVYITIDCDGFDPAIMPAVGTPEPGGLTWYEALALLRRVIESRRVVGCDIVELCPLPGNVAPNFLCAKLIYKILSYRFGREIAPKPKSTTRADTDRITR